MPDGYDVALHEKVGILIGEVRSMQTQMAAFQTQLDNRFDSHAEEMREKFKTAGERVGSVEKCIDDLDSNLSALRERVADIEGQGKGKRRGDNGGRGNGVHTATYSRPSMFPEVLRHPAVKWGGIAGGSAAGGAAIWELLQTVIRKLIAMFGTPP